MMYAIDHIEAIWKQPRNGKGPARSQSSSGEGAELERFESYSLLEPRSVPNRPC